MDHQADANRTDLMTITRFVLNEQSKYTESRGDFTILLSHIVLGCKFVCNAVNKVFFSLHPSIHYSLKHYVLMFLHSLFGTFFLSYFDNHFLLAGGTGKTHRTCWRDKCSSEFSVFDHS